MKETTLNKARAIRTNKDLCLFFIRQSRDQNGRLITIDVNSWATICRYLNIVERFAKDVAIVSDGDAKPGSVYVNSVEQNWALHFNWV